MEYIQCIYILQGFIFRIYPLAIERVVNYIGYNIFTINMFLYNFIITPILAIITIMGILGIAKLIEKNRKVSRILFGR